MFHPFSIRSTCHTAAFAYWFLPMLIPCVYFLKAPSGVGVEEDVEMKEGGHEGGEFIGFESAQESE